MGRAAGFYFLSFLRSCFVADDYTEEVENVLEETAAEDAEMSAAEYKHYHKICRLNDEVRIAEREFDNAKAVAKCKKETLEIHQARLSNLISDGPEIPDPQMELPFDDDRRNWDQVPVTDAIKLTESQADKLESAGIKTMGRLEFVRGGNDPDYPRGLRSIKGFGEKTIDAIENDIVEWLSKNLKPSESDDKEAQ